MTIHHTYIDMMIGTSIQLMRPEDANATYTSAHSKIAHVTTHGIVMGQSFGRTTITVSDQVNDTKQNITVQVNKPLPVQNTIPTHEIDPPQQIIIDRESEQYIGQPDSILLDDDQTILTVYPLGHGIGTAVLNKSVDGGCSWEGRTIPNETWKDSRETPTVYKLNFTDGSQKLLMISGGPGWGEDQFKGWKTSLSTDNGVTWQDYQTWYEGTQTIVAMASLVQLKNHKGQWINKWLGVYHDAHFVNHKTYLTFDDQGHEQWSVPEPYLKPHREIESTVQLCEACIFRSPNDQQLILIARSQSHMHTSTISFSNDEGNTWTPPRPLPGSLNGERHQAQYDPISGRLVISFREILLDYNNNGAVEDDDWMAGNWVAWVGTYDDLIHGEVGEYRILLGADYTPSRKSGDCGYAGNVVKTDGTFILNSYGYFDPKEVERLGTKATPYIIGVRFKLADFDKQ